MGKKWAWMSAVPEIAVSSDDIKPLKIPDGIIDAWITWWNAVDARYSGAGTANTHTAVIKMSAPDVTNSRLDTNSKVSSKASFSSLLLT